MAVTVFEVDQGGIAAEIRDADASSPITRDYTFDAFSRLTELKATRGATVVQHDQFGHDSRDNVTFQRDLVAGRRQCYTYDLRQRLRQAYTANSATACGTGGAAGGAAYNLTWTVDRIGNITNVAYPGGSDTYYYGTTAWGTGGPHAVTSLNGAAGRYSYNQVGQLTSRYRWGGWSNYGWDTQGRICWTSQTQTPPAGASCASPPTGNGTAAQRYWPDGSRALRRETSGGITTTTVYLEGRELTRTVAGPVVGNVTRYYSIGEATVASRTASGLTWLFGNHQGTISRATADATGATTANYYDPFGGRLTPDTITINRGFIGQIEDNTTGLVYLNNRYYDPTIGRFASVDPLAFPDSPQTLNPYSYAGNNPTTYSDPSGLCFEFADAASLGIDASKINCATIATADKLNETTSFADVPINVWSASDAGIVEIIEKNLPAFGSDNWLGGVSSQIGAKYDMAARAQAARIAGQSLGFLDFAVVGLALTPIAIGGVIQGAAWLGKPLGGAVVCAATEGSICPSPLPGAPQATSWVDDATAPVGRRGSPIDIAPGTNSPAVIGGRQYTGHALDRMQGRGIMPSAVDDAISTSRGIPGADGSLVHYGPTNNISVVLNGNGSVRTVSYGVFKPR